MIYSSLLWRHRHTNFQNIDAMQGCELSILIVILIINRAGILVHSATNFKLYRSFLYIKWNIVKLPLTNNNELTNWNDTCL